MCEESWHAQCDATFSATPAVPPYTQLFTLHAVDTNYIGQTKHVYPVVYALMTSRTSAGYQAVLNYLVRPPASLMADFEPALRSVFTRLWPGIDIKGCWFYYSQALWKRAVSTHRLLPLLRRSGEAKRVYDLLNCLPLVPPHNMDEALEVAEAERVGVRQQMVGLFHHVEHYWFSTIGRAVLLVGGSDSRTNNAVESFYSQLRGALDGGSHPNFYGFLIWPDEAYKNTKVVGDSPLNTGGNTAFFMDKEGEKNLSLLNILRRNLPEVAELNTEGVINGGFQFLEKGIKINGGKKLNFSTASWQKSRR
ncbi:hypothetical protein M8J77_025689 [Diaphorina citri]|nr:hypothetical protein M8J77_025689 [Diaphorina citri]